MTKWFYNDSSGVNEENMQNSIEINAFRGYQCFGNNKGDLTVPIERMYRDVDKQLYRGISLYGIGAYRQEKHIMLTSALVKFKVDDFNIKPFKFLKPKWLTTGTPIRDDIVNYMGNLYLYNDDPIDASLETGMGQLYMQNVKDYIGTSETWSQWITANDLRQLMEDDGPISTAPAYDEIHRHINGDWYPRFAHTDYLENGDIIAPTIQVNYCFMAYTSGYDNYRRTRQYLEDYSTWMVSGVRTEFSIDRDPPSSDVRPYIKEGIKDRGDGKVIIIDPDTSEFKQILRPLNPLGQYLNKSIDTGNSSSPKTQKVVYRKGDGSVVDEYENQKYGYGIEFPATNTLGSGKLAHNGDFLVITSNCMFNLLLSGYNAHYFDIYKRNQESNLWEPHQTLSAAIPQESFGYQVGNGWRWDRLMLTTSQLHMEMNDKFLLCYNPMYGPNGYGGLAIYERGLDDLYTFSTILSSPLKNENRDDHSKYLIPYHSGYANFGRMSQFLGDYLFAWSSNFYLPQFTLSGNVNTKESTQNLYILDTNNNFTCVNYLSSDLITYDNIDADILFHETPTAFNTLLRRHTNVKNKIIRVTGRVELAVNLPDDFSGDFTTNGNFIRYITVLFNRQEVKMHYDLIELVDGVPTITKRMETSYSPDLTVTYGLIDPYSKETLDKYLGNTAPHYLSFDDKYLYYPSNRLFGVDANDEIRTTDKHILPIENPGIGRIRLDDEKYFKPMTEYGYNGPVAITGELNLPTKCGAIGMDRGDQELYEYFDRDDYDVTDVLPCALGNPPQYEGPQPLEEKIFETDWVEYTNLVTY
jgi:hypothetical protein